MVITTGAAVAFHLAPSQDHYQFNSPISKREFNRAVLYSQLYVSVWCVCFVLYLLTFYGVVERSFYKYSDSNVLIYINIK